MTDVEQTINILADQRNKAMDEQAALHLAIQKQAEIIKAKNAEIEKLKASLKRARKKK